MSWAEAYGEFLRSAYEFHAWDRRPSYVLGWIDHPILKGSYLVDLKVVFGKRY